MNIPNLSSKKIILASKSPRRQQLMQGLGLQFEVRTKDVDESFPAELQAEAIPLYLARIKADAFKAELSEDEILITADTVVWINGHVMNKPEDRNEAIAMISELSGNIHDVYTGVCITSAERQVSFTDETRVFFAELTREEIEFYVDNHKPFDKAGAYGAQDWIGLAAITRLEGSYFNVMGLPVHLLYKHLKNF